MLNSMLLVAFRQNGFYVAMKNSPNIGFIGYLCLSLRLFYISGIKIIG